MGLPAATHPLKNPDADGQLDGHENGERRGVAIGTPDAYRDGKEEEGCEARLEGAEYVHGASFSQRSQTAGADPQKEGGPQARPPSLPICIYGGRL